MGILQRVGNKFIQADKNWSNLKGGMKDIANMNKAKKTENQTYKNIGSGMMDKEFSKDELKEFGTNESIAKNKAANLVKTEMKKKVPNPKKAISDAKTYVEDQRNKFDKVPYYVVTDEELKGLPPKKPKYPR